MILGGKCDSPEKSFWNLYAVRISLWQMNIKKIFILDAHRNHVLIDSLSFKPILGIYIQHNHGQVSSQCAEETAQREISNPE